MPVHPYLNAFTTGETTEQLIARQDWAKYQHSAACLRNFVVRPHGGAARRAGLLFLGQAKFPDRRVRLKKFEFSVTQAYVVEFGHLYARFWANRALVTSGGVPVEVVTPYTEDDLRELRFEQSADVMYIAHPDYEPRKLQRTSATAFQLDVILFNPGPTAEQREAPVANLSLTATSGFSVTVTTDVAAFLAGDVGRQIRSGAGRAVIRTFVTGSNVTVDILDTFATTGPIPSGQWTLDGSPNAGTLTPSVKTPEGAGTTLTSSVNAFRSSDVGKFAYLLAGIVRVTQFNSPTQITGQIVKPLTDTPAAAAIGTWTLEAPAWSLLNGFPGVVALHQQRLWWAGSNAFPDRIWGSVVADYENLSRGVADDDAVEYQLAMSGVNLIRWLKALPEGLAVGTMAGELTLSGGGTDAPLTPTNVQVRERTFYGADFVVDAIRTTNLVIFLQRGGRRLREFTINQESISGEYVAPDLTLVSEHLTREGIVEMDRAAAPDSLLFAITGDGVLLSCAYERPENVVGWSHHESDEGAQGASTFESVAVIPNSCNTGDEVYVAVRRLLPQGDYFHENYFHTNYWAQNPWYFKENLTTPFRYIELFDGRLNVDSGLVYAGAAAGTFSGLNHLDGKTVKAVDQDGTVYDLVVVGGSIALPDLAQATELEVGLHYTSTLKTVRPELQTQAGTAQARKKHWAFVTPRVYCTRGRLLLNEAVALEYPEGTDLAAAFTGDLAKITNFGWDREGQLTVQTTEPKPCTVLALTGGLELDDP